jgi:hypothetical protein
MLDVAREIVVYAVELLRAHAALTTLLVALTVLAVRGAETAGGD